MGLDPSDADPDLLVETMKRIRLAHKKKKKIIRKLYLFRKEIILFL